MPVTFIGDVHGQFEALEEILPQCEGRLIFMGDLIDRGPDSKAVVQRVRQLCADDQATCILGNHEFALVSSLGLPELGVPAKPHFFSAWCQIYGGFNTLMSYEVENTDIDEVRQLFREDLEWMYGLPWFYQSEVDGSKFLAVHAGLNQREATGLQLAALADPAHWWTSNEQLPPALYEHKRATQNPPDLAEDLCVVSGHTVQPAVYVSDQRVLCDTSGGRPGRLLSAVVWPQGRVISAPTAMI